MKPRMMPVAVIAVAFAAAVARAGDAKVHEVAKDGLSIQGKVSADDPKVKIHEVEGGLKLSGQISTGQGATHLVKLISGKRYVFDMLSADPKSLPPRLRLLDENGKDVADDAMGITARIVYTADRTSTYRVLATSSGNGRGRFLLTVREARAKDRILTSKDQPELRRATALDEKALSLNRAGQVRDAFKPAYEACAIRKELLGEQHPNYASSLNTLALLYKSQWDLAKAEPLYREALDIYKDVFGEKDPRYAVVLNNLALLYERHGRYADAELLCRQALAICKDVFGAKDRACARALNDLGLVCARQGKFADAERLYGQALDIFKELLGEKDPAYVTSLSNLATLYSEQADYARADELCRQALSIRKEVLGEKDPYYADSLSELAFVQMGCGDNAKAERLMIEALEIRKARFGQNSPENAASLNNLAGVYEEQGNHAKAVPLFVQALKIREERLGKQHPAYAESLHNLAGCYERQGEHARAEDLYRKALELRRKVLGEQHPHYAEGLNNLGLMYARQESYAKAKALYLEALEIKRKTLGEKHPSYAGTLNNLASLYEALADFENAEKSYRRALELRKKALGERHPLYAMSLNNLAFLHQLQGNHATAGPLYAQAVRALQVTQRGVPIEELAADDFRLHPDTVMILHNRALAVWQAAVTDRSSRSLPSCDRAILLPLLVLERVRQHGLDQPESKIRVAEKYFNLFSDRIGVLARLFNLDQDPRALEAALWTAETGSARAFVEMFGRNRANLIAGVSPALLGQENEVLQEIRLLDLRIDKESGRPLEQRNSALVGELLARRRAFDEKLRKLVVEIEKLHPQYAGLKYPRPCSLLEARKCLAPDEAALLFVPGSDASYVVVVEARPKRDDPTRGLAIIELPRSELLAGHVDALKEVDTLALPARVKALGRAAFDAILGPCKERIAGKSLVVVPGGPLCMLPFELLVEEDGQYLVEKHRLRYAPSLTAIHLINRWKEKRGQPEVPLFAVGDAIYEAGDVRVAKASRPVEVASASAEGVLDLQARQGKRDALKRLMASGMEVAEIAKVLGAKANYLLTGEAASEAKVKAASAAETMAQARYVHFATHGILGVDKGKDPALVLNLVGNSGKDGDDGFLEYDEILNLKLNADLVVLSACRTGQGRMARGEGVTGLARAFLYAGSKGVVCSLWSVDDRETANLMVDFYGHLQEGRSAADALRDAQLAMIRAGKAPLYWAPFVLIGE